VHAPGLRDPALAVRVSHHLLLSHGLAVRALRARGAGEVGIALNVTPAIPETDSPEDAAAARRRVAIEAGWFLDPIFLGSYPPEVLAIYRRLGWEPPVQDGDLATIAQPIDLLGLNYYTRGVVRHDPDAEPFRVTVADRDAELTAMGWAIDPQGLEDVLREVHERYAPRSILISENGAAFDDEVSPDGAVHDERRIAYLRDHVAAAARAIEAGVPVRGYLAWSLLDNFEWAHGYTKRFGLVHVDHETQRRIVKDSGWFYRSVIEANGTPDEIAVAAEDGA
jgi:beta-glucosidase